MFLIPVEYEGSVIVVYGIDTAGNEEWSDDGRRIYRIPESGILYTPFSKNLGIADSKYMFVDSLGNPLTEINTDFTDGQSWHNDIYMMNGGLVNVWQNGQGESPIHYRAFSIGRGSKKDSLNIELRQFKQDFVFAPHIKLECKDSLLL